MKFIFDNSNTLIESENNEKIIQGSVNANEINVAWLNFATDKYAGYISFERADGKTTPLIAMQYCEFNNLTGFKYGFSDAWVTSVAGQLKVLFTLKESNKVVKTSTITLNVVNSIVEDEVNYIDNVTYEEFSRRLLEAEKKIPTRNSQLVNDSNYVKEEKMIDYVAEKTPTKISQLENDVNLVNVEFVENFVETEMPKNVSELINDSQYITKEVDDLLHYPKFDETYNIINQHLIDYYTKDESYNKNQVNQILDNYYTKANTYNRNEIDNKITSIPKFNIEVVSTLPTSNISSTTVYLVSNGNGQNLYTEYIYVNNKWELLGSQNVDLSGYVKEEDLPTKVSQLENDSDYVTEQNVLQMIDEATAIINIGELNQAPNDSNNSILNALDMDGIYAFTYLGSKGFVFVNKHLSNNVGNYDVIQSILYSNENSGFEFELLQRIIGFENYELFNCSIIEHGIIATVGGVKAILEQEYLTADQIEELLANTSGGVSSEDVLNIIEENSEQVDTEYSVLTSKLFNGSISDTEIPTSSAVQEIVNTALGDIGAVLDVLNGEV